MITLNYNYLMTDNKQELRRRDAISEKINKASGPARALVKNKLKVLEKIRLIVAKAIKEKKTVPIFHNLMPIVSSMEVLQLAYGNIKSNKGSMTPGTQGQTADEMSIKRLEKLSNELKTGKYKFPDVRRNWIPKPGKNVDWSKKENLLEFGRPLGMPDFDPKIVQEAIRLTLNAIYEPIFEHTNVSFGFRPNKGCHDAVVNIPTQTQGMQRAIEGDIKGAFNNLNHDKLIKILRLRINDEKLLSLIYCVCRAGIFDQLQDVRTDSLLGVPQGGIVSPLLWNIYMHEFDKFILNDIDELIATVNKRQKRTPTAGNAIYKSLIYKKSKYKKIYEDLTKAASKKLKDLHPEQKARALSALAEAKRVKKLMLKTTSKNAGRLSIRYYYIRYAGDWILITNAKQTLAQYIKNKIASFLKYELGLTLSMEKTKITDLRKDKAKFLSFSIKNTEGKKITFTSNGVLKRVTGQKLSIGIDTERLLTRMEWHHYISKKNGKLIPREQPSWSVLSDYEIIQKYNAIIRGFVMYYAPIITTRSTMNRFIYYYEYSCYKTLCQKHRTSIRKLLKKHKKNFTAVIKDEHGKNKERSASLITVKAYWGQLKSIVDTVYSNLTSKNRDPALLASSDFLNNAKTSWRTSFKLNIGGCVVCGSTESVEMHHIKHVRGYSKDAKQGFERIMGLLNRKQIPVCKFHHNEIHSGRYDSISLSDLYDTRIATVENYLRIY
jgi:retron-type reverse transcriptase